MLQVIRLLRQENSNWTPLTRSKISPFFLKTVIHVIRPDIVGTYRYWAPKYESRSTDWNSRYISIPIFHFCQTLKLVFRSLQMLALSKFTTGSGLYWFFAKGKSAYLLSSVNKNQHISDIWLVAWTVLIKSMSIYSKDPKNELTRKTAKRALKLVQFRF